MHAPIRVNPSRRQQGNTLVGIIIGLVIGLGIAVVVALAITKGTLPFTDKAGKAPKAAEPSAGQVSDPNKPLYGNKDAARAAAKDFANDPKAPPDDPLQQAIANLPPDPVQAAAPAPAPAKPAPKAEHEIRVVGVDKSAPAAPPPVKADADDKYIYYLQIGAFREMADAESVRAKLALLGFEAVVSDRSSDTGVLHRVRMGPFNQVEAMNRTRSKLSENGVDVAVVRNQK